MSHRDLPFSKLTHHRIIEYPDLDRTYEDHLVTTTGCLYVNLQGE